MGGPKEANDDGASATVPGGESVEAEEDAGIPPPAGVDGESVRNLPAKEGGAAAQVPAKGPAAAAPDDGDASAAGAAPAPPARAAVAVDHGTSSAGPAPLGRGLGWWGGDHASGLTVADSAGFPGAGRE